MKLSERFTPISSVDLAWRVLALVNLFRLLVPLLLMILFLTIAPRPVGLFRPSLFSGTATAYFLFAAGAISSIRSRWPVLELQTLISVRR